MLKSNFIPEAFVEQGYIEPKGDEVGLFLPCRFTYLPMLVEERLKLTGAYKTMGADDAQRFEADVLAKKLKSWDIVKPDNSPVEIKPVNLLRLRPALLTRLSNVICGYSASDTDPNWADEAKVEHAKVKYESALSDSVHETRETMEAKN